MTVEEAIDLIPQLLEEQERRHGYRLNAEERKIFVRSFLQQLADYLVLRRYNVN
jgi:hypothetical protein